MSLTTNEFDQPLGHLVHGWTPPAFPAPLEMQGSYCTVEPFDPDAHGSALFDALSEIESDWTYLPYGPFGDLASFQDWIQTTCLGDDPQFYTLLENETGNPGGVASYLRITPQSGTIEVGTHSSWASLEAQQGRDGGDVLDDGLRVLTGIPPVRVEMQCVESIVTKRSSQARVHI